MHATYNFLIVSNDKRGEFEVKQKWKKTGVILIGCMMFIGAISGCGSKVHTEPKENQFDARILEKQDDYILVEALQGQGIEGEVQVWTGLLEEDSISGMEKGLMVRITHSGQMTMSLPPQMSAVAIEVLEK